MNKDIKNYLHLYLGCEVYNKAYPNFSFRLDAIQKWGSHHVNAKLEIIIEEPDEPYPDVNWVEVRDGNIKPILRPLSDMTEEDHAERMKLKTNPEEIRYLLSKGFDLFDLIPAGLAIDKTTLKISA